ncbi:MAG: hypothetical protein RL745_148, partial [Actinomycetota bacterium]
MQSAWTAQQSHVWPNNSGRDADGLLSVGGCRVDDLLRQHGSPLFVIDRDDVLARAQRYRDAYVNVADEPAGAVFYAGKAFMSIGVARWLLAAGLNLDVCTEGELAVALAAGATGDRLLMHGNNKSDNELRLAVQHAVSYVVVDSMDEIARLAAIAAEAAAVVDVLVRVTVGVEAHTHEFIMTAHEDQKFGFSIANGSAVAAVRAVMAQSSLRLAGLHSHIGSQIFDTHGFEVAVQRLAEFSAQLRNNLGVSVEHLNIGGGTGIAYVDADDPQDIHAFAERMRARVRECFAAANTPLPSLIVEPGRSIIGRAGITVYTVGSIKPVEVDDGSVRTYVAVDGGMSDNIRPALYSADYTVACASRSIDEASPT